MPAPIASWVVTSSAATRSAAKPNSAARSNAPARPASLMTSAALSIVSKLAPPRLALDQAGDVLVERSRCGCRVGIDVDELLAVRGCGRRCRRRRRAAVPGSAERGAGDDDRLVRRAGEPAAPRDPSSGVASVEEVGEQLPELDVGVVAGGALAWMRPTRPLAAARPARSAGAATAGAERPTGVASGPAGAEAGGVQAAQGLVEGDDVALLRVVGEQDRRRRRRRGRPRRTRAAPASGRPRRTPGRRRRTSVCSPSTNCTGRGDLAGEQVDHLGRRRRAHRVEVAGHVGHDRDRGRREVAAARSMRRSGSLAGATIAVWKAWLTGRRRGW